MRYILLIMAIAIFQSVSAQSVGIGTTTPAPSAALEIKSSSGALLLPRMTTVQRDVLSPVLGMLIYNTDVNKFQGYAFGATQNVVQIDTGTSVVPRSIVAGYWIMHQSFTAPSTTSITSIQIVTDVPSNTPGTLQVLAGNGTGGSSLYSQSFTYTGCGSGKCITQINLTTPLCIVNGTAYTLKFSATSGGFSTFTNGSNPYSGGQVYQNTTAIATEDMFLRLQATGATGWIDLH